MLHQDLVHPLLCYLEILQKNLIADEGHCRGLTSLKSAEYGVYLIFQKKKLSHQR